MPTEPNVTHSQKSGPLGMKALPGHHGLEIISESLAEVVMASYVPKERVWIID
jgi:hypothetical protein